MKTLNKIYNCIKSCKTTEQFVNAFNMLLLYSTYRSNNISEIIMMLEIQEYAIMKGKLLAINELQ